MKGEQTAWARCAQPFKRARPSLASPQDSKAETPQPCHFTLHRWQKEGWRTVTSAANFYKKKDFSQHPSSCATLSSPSPPPQPPPGQQHSALEFHLSCSVFPSSRKTKLLGEGRGRHWERWVSGPHCLSKANPHQLHPETGESSSFGLISTPSTGMLWVARWREL